MASRNSPRWRALVVDDERLARLSLRGQLDAMPDLVVVGEAASAREALEWMRNTPVNLLFLDVQMPEIDGFGLIEKIDAAIPVIFVTASDRFAVRAFEVNALDYLVKPVSTTRLRAALDRLNRATPPTRSPANRPSATPASGGDVLFLPLEKSRIFVPLDLVVTITSQRNNSVVDLVDGRRFVVRRSLRQWTDYLDPGLFARINRKTLVHLKYIRSLTPKPGGLARAVVGNAEQPEPISRRLAAPLKRLLDRYRG